MTGALAELWSEYHRLSQLWKADHQDDPDSITVRQLELAEQMAAIEPTNLGEIAIQAQLLADMLVAGDALEPEQSLAVSRAKRLAALARS
jgi:hypothetical protein